MHVDMLTLFKKLLKMINNNNAKGENGEMHLYLTCKNKHDGVILILFMVFNPLFTSPNSKHKIV
jgi:hypothetical protein